MAAVIGLTTCITTVFAVDAVMSHIPEQVTKAEFTAAGHTYNVNFGDYKFKLDFESAKKMTFTSLIDPKVHETVNIAVTKLRDNLFMVSWQDKSGNNVVHIEDFKNMVVYTNISMKNGSFIHLKGYLTRVK